MKNQILEVGESCGQKEELVKRGNYIKGFPSKVLTEMRAPCSVCINGWRLEFYLRDIIFCGQHHSIIAAMTIQHTQLVMMGWMNAMMTQMWEWSALSLIADFAKNFTVKNPVLSKMFNFLGL